MDQTIEYLKGEKIPFLSKYGEALGYGNVVPVRDFVIEMIQLGLRKSPPNSNFQKNNPLGTLETIKEALTSYVAE